MNVSKNKYHDYLNSEKWKQGRLNVIGVHENKCFLCEKKHEFLHIHHLHYFTLFHERLKDVIPLCTECHMKVHEDKNHVLNPINTKIEDFINDDKSSLRDWFK